MGPGPSGRSGSAWACGPCSGEALEDVMRIEDSGRGGGRGGGREREGDGGRDEGCDGGRDRSLQARGFELYSI
jgi:hypothetical protein